MGVLRTGALAAVTTLVSLNASAHVTVQPRAAEAGSHQVLRFGVGHGCDERATTRLDIDIPAEIAVARPQPKPGWRLSIERRDGHVHRVTWRGRLPADQYDEFLILIRASDHGGQLAFPATQSCGRATSVWRDLPGDNAPPPRRPAPTLDVTPSTDGAAAPHHSTELETPHAR